MGQLDLLADDRPQLRTKALAPAILGLREYQQLALECATAEIITNDNPLICLPTGSGKSVVIAALAQRTPGRILVLSHVKEILEQNRKAYESFTGRLDAAFYGEGLGEKNVRARVIFANVQSAYRATMRLTDHGRFSLVIIDEVHLYGGEETKMYSHCVKEFAAPVAGFTATPYRLNGGLIYGDEPDKLFRKLTIKIKAKDLTPKYLSPLSIYGTENDIDTEGVRKLAGDFRKGELEDAAMSAGLSEKIVGELIEKSAGRKKILIFACGVAHGNEIAELLKKRKQKVAEVYGDTETDERRERVNGFKADDFRFFVNVGIATIGFDVPDLDCIAVLRPTLSKSLIDQIYGRGTRRAEGKTDCLILDFAKNFLVHGAFDEYAGLYHESAKVRKKREAKENAKAQKREYWESLDASNRQVFTVDRISIFECHSKTQEGKINLKVGYKTPNRWFNVWLCVEYSGPARWAAVKWFMRRGILAKFVPYSASECLRIALKAPKPHEIVVADLDKPFPRVLIERFDNDEF